MVVLLLVLVLPVAHTEAAAAPVAALAGEVVEADVLDTALRPPGRGAHRPVVPQRPVRPASPVVGSAPVREPQAPTGPPYLLRTLRSVVLRC
ncbi:hypothetical protein IPT68_17750 [Streptomyces chromofuscus]|uniref:Secreted protein n=1 Tax=Streptomyces chromofuscus TaxID=42881 RepID=A0A7M2TI91_STRCW|nr:hypothetical protein IPT68_17750 [Streptomyces chromofuscus]